MSFIDRYDQRKTSDSPLGTIRTVVNGIRLHFSTDTYKKLSDKERHLTDSLMLELNRFCNKNNRYIFRYNTQSNRLDMKHVGMNHRLDFLLYDVIGKNEIYERFSNIVKIGLSLPDYKLREYLDKSPIFKVGDIVRASEIKKGHDMDLSIITSRPAPIQQIWVENLSDSSLIKTLHQETLLRYNPEYIIRYLNDNTYPFFDFKLPDCVNPTLEEFDQYTSDNGKYNVYDTYWNSLGSHWDNIDLKPRLKILLDIIGKDKLQEELLNMCCLARTFSDDKLNKYEIFKRDDIVRVDEDLDLFKVRTVNSSTFEVHAENIKNGDHYKRLSQAQLLKLNPEYYKRYLNSKQNF